MRAGLLAPQDVIARTGRTPEELVEDLTEWRDMTAGLALDPDYSQEADMQGDPDAET